MLIRTSEKSEELNRYPGFNRSRVTLPFTVQNEIKLTGFKDTRTYLQV